MRPLSESTARVTGKTFQRKYIALGRIVTHWPEIVGESLAAKAQPVKINYRKHKGAKKPLACLDIAVSSAEATVLHYQKGLILERINQIFGQGWINSIRFVHGGAPGGAAPGALIKKRPLPLTVAQKDSLSGWLDMIEDPEMKARLRRLGHGVLRQGQEGEIK